MDVGLAREVDRVPAWHETRRHARTGRRRRRDQLLTRRQLQALIDASLQAAAQPGASAATDTAGPLHAAAAVVRVERGVRPGSRGTARLPNLTVRRCATARLHAETVVRVEWTDGVGATVLEVLVRCVAAPAADSTPSDVLDTPVIALLTE